MFTQPSSPETLRLADGGEITLRPVRPEDQPAVADAIRTASRETLLHRFFTPLRALAPEELHRLLHIDPAREYCVVGEVADGRIVCGARYVRMPVSGRAEIALTVHDDFQRRGLGRHLLRHLIRQGRADGIHTFVADVMADNSGMLKLLRDMAPHRHADFGAGVCHVEFDLNDAVTN
jgi:acetyltransferase